ncbi:hypothetical protein JCM5353_003637 [Sporobolomyces roseus]
MSRSLSLVTLLALTSTSVFASNEIVEADQSPAPFQLNLARTFSSTIDQLKKRDGFKATVPKVSRAKERSISDDLVALLKLAGSAYDASPSQHTAAASKPSAIWDPSKNSEHTHAASKPTGSKKPSHALAGKPYKPNGPSSAYTHAAAATHKPKPSSAYTHAAAPSKPTKSAAYQPDKPDHTMAAAPAGASSEHNAKRGMVSIGEVQKRIQDEPWENLDSQLLCPAGETACPIFPRMGTYECIDTSSELENCGGCSSRSQGEDCTLIKGALAVTCKSSKCNVFTCQPGYTFSEASRDGHGGCTSTSTKKAGFFGAKLRRE